MRAWDFQRRYEAPINPLTLRWIDPNCIDRKVANEPLLFNTVDIPGSPMNGDWDRQTESVEKHPYHDFFHEHFENSVPWDETAFFLQLKGKITKSEGDETVWHSCRTIDDLYRRCQEIDYMYEFMEKNGYLTQRELAAKKDVPLGLPTGCMPPELNEVAIAISRDGEIMFADGGHRFFLSRLLDIETIPTYVLVRHTEWQSIRDTIYASNVGVSDDIRMYIDHPDVDNS